MKTTATATFALKNAARRTGLNLNWYDLSVAGLVIVSGIGAIVRIVAA